MNILEIKASDLPFYMVETRSGPDRSWARFTISPLTKEEAATKIVELEQLDKRGESRIAEYTAKEWRDDLLDELQDLFLCCSDKEINQRTEHLTIKDLMHILAPTPPLPAPEVYQAPDASFLDDS